MVSKRHRGGGERFHFHVGTAYGSARAHPLFDESQLDCEVKQFPGYDLVAVNPDNSRSARIQVKSRWATNYDRSFLIKNFDCEFVVHVALNRGYRFGKTAKEGKTEIRAPDFYVFPVAVVRDAQNTSDKWGKVKIRNILDYEQYKDGWHLITEHLYTP